MMPFEPGDVLLVPFPFTDQTALKKRPAVVVSSVAYNASRPDIVLMALSSNLSAPATPLVRWQEAGLPKETAFKPVLTTLESRKILKKLGALSPLDLDVLRALLKEILLPCKKP